MKKPELKVVRFEAEDVIATSGFYTNGDELKQSRDNNVTVSGSFNEGANEYYSVTFNNETAYVGSAVYQPADNQYKWAWFDEYNKVWWTNHEHDINGNYSSTGIDSLTGGSLE